MSKELDEIIQGSDNLTRDTFIVMENEIGKLLVSQNDCITKYNAWKGIHE
jgi:hypothetical protein